MQGLDKFFCEDIAPAPILEPLQGFADIVLLKTVQLFPGVMCPNFNPSISSGSSGVAPGEYEKLSAILLPKILRRLDQYLLGHIVQSPFLLFLGQGLFLQTHRILQRLQPF